MRGRKNPDKPPTCNILPPCRVCGEPGTGFHYGVTTCGACKTDETVQAAPETSDHIVFHCPVTKLEGGYKTALRAEEDFRSWVDEINLEGFFRRSLTRQEPYVCIQSHLCYVGPSTSRRQSCPKCRYDKCIDVGMSKDACKVGRYSLIKKSNDIKEAMEEKELPLPLSSPSSTSSVCENADIWQQLSNETDNELSPDTPGAFFNKPIKQEYLKFTSNDDVFPDPSERELGGENVDLTSNRDSALDLNKINGMDSITSTFAILDFNSDCPYGFHNEISGSGDDMESHDFCTSMTCNNDNINEDERTTDNEMNGISNNFLLNSTSQESENNGHIAPSYTVLKSPASYSRTPEPWTNSVDNIDNATIPISTFFQNNDTNKKATTSSYNLTNSTQLASNDPAVGNCKSINPTHQSFSILSNMEINREHDSNKRDPFCDISKHTKASEFTTEMPSSQLSTDLHQISKDSNSLHSKVSDDATEPDSSSKTIVSYSFSHSNITPFDDNTFNHDSPIIDRHVSGISKKRIEEICKEDELSTKRLRLSGNRDTSSSKLLTVENTNSMIPISKQLSSDKESKPLILFIVPPDPIKYALSIFERFPFKSFEKESLAPMLKLCYDVSDKSDEYLPSSLVKQNQLRSIGYHSREDNGTYTYHLSSFLTSSQSSELQSCVGELCYDATEMDNLYDYIQAIHCRYYGPKSAYLSASERTMFIEMFSKICQLQDTLQGTMNLIDDDKYFTILETTGIDVDKRREWFSSVFGDFDAAFTRDARFFRALPGFKDFTIKDRVTLTKSTFVIFLLLRHYQTADFDKGVIIDEEKGVACRLTTFRRILPGVSGFIDRWIDTVEALKDLDISFEELIILKVLCIVLPDLCEELEKPNLIREWHNTYLKCLLHLLRKTHGPDADERFKMIVGFLQQVKGLHEPMKEGRLSVTDTIRRLTEGQEQPLFEEMFVNLPYHQVPRTSVGGTHGL